MNNKEPGEPQKAGVKIYRDTILDKLHAFWNHHLQEHLAHTVNLRTLKKMGDKDIWGHRQIAVAGGKPVMNPILAKEILPDIQRDHDKNLKILMTITEMIEVEEGKTITDSPYDFQYHDQN